MKKEALRVTTTVPVAPTTLYFAWIDSDHHAAMTSGAAAKFDPNVGGNFSALNGFVSGKLVILDLGRRLVMSWRTSDFPRDAADSRVEIHLEALGSSTRILVLHTDIPEGQSESYKALWNEKYFGPMRTYFSKFLPDPRNPPVRRPPPPPPEDDEDEEEEEEVAPKKKLGKLAGSKGSSKGSASGPSIAKAESKPSKAAPAPPPAKAKSAPPPPAPKAKSAPPPKPSKPAKPAPAKKPAPAPAKKPAKAVAKKAPPAKKPAAKKPAPAKKPAAKKPAAKKPAAKKK